MTNTPSTSWCGVFMPERPCTRQPNQAEAERRSHASSTKMPLCELFLHRPTVQPTSAMSDGGDDERVRMLPDDHVAERDIDAASLQGPFDDKASLEEEEGSAVSVLLGSEDGAPEKIGKRNAHALLMCYMLLAADKGDVIINEQQLLQATMHPPSSVMSTEGGSLLFILNRKDPVLICSCLLVRCHSGFVDHVTGLSCDLHGARRSQQLHHLPSPWPVCAIVSMLCSYIRGHYCGLWLYCILALVLYCGLLRSRY